jgi:hypothetical protein
VVPATPPHHDSSAGFLASFYATWPESEVFDDTSRRIWDTLHLGFAQADSVYDAHDDRQSTLQTTLDARHKSLQRATKTDFGHLESYVYQSTSITANAVATALQRLDRVDATLVTLLENLTNMKQQLATTNQTVIDGFNEHATTLVGITDGLSSQTAALAALEARLRTHSGILDQLSRTSEAQSTRLDEVVTRMDSTADTLRNEVAEVRASLIPDLCSKVKMLDATLQAALARLPPLNNPGHKPASHSPTDQDASPSATTANPAAASDSPLGGTPTTSAAPHNVRFGAALRDGQVPQSSLGDSCFGPTRSFMSPSRSDDSWYRPGNRVPHVTPGPHGRSLNNDPHHVHHQDQRPPRLSMSHMSHGDPMLGGSFRQIISP